MQYNLSNKKEPNLAIIRGALARNWPSFLKNTKKTELTLKLHWEGLKMEILNLRLTVKKAEFLNQFLTCWFFSTKESTKTSFKCRSQSDLNNILGLLSKFWTLTFLILNWFAFKLEIHARMSHLNSITAYIQMKFSR